MHYFPQSLLPAVLFPSEHFSPRMPRLARFYINGVRPIIFLSSPFRTRVLLRDVVPEKTPDRDAINLTNRSVRCPTRVELLSRYLF